jgi:hypothetical protein
MARHAPANLAREGPDIALGTTCIAVGSGLLTLGEPLTLNHRYTRSSRGFWLLPATSIWAPVLILCCDEGSPARPTVDAAAFIVPADVGDEMDAGATEPDVQPSYAVCPDALAPTFPSIFTRVLATASCGIGDPYDCHSSTGALPIGEGGTGSLLDFSLDASSVFRELLGDGSGFPASNVMGNATLLRVDPGNADASLLYIKLAMPTERDPRYGEAMPPTGLVCPATLEAVQTWINDGASRQ